ncbi:MAG: hypothetical protein IJ666_05830 [Ruminococcus sp.]|nr:hypothetical protein [Ruminococcus sp.]
MKNKAFLLIFNYIALILMNFIYGYQDGELQLSTIYFFALTFFLILGIKNIADGTREVLIEIYNKIFSGATFLLFADGICRLVNGQAMSENIGDVLYTILMVYCAGVCFYYLYWKPYHNFYRK